MSRLREMDDSVLLERFNARDIDAYETVYSMFYKDLYLYAHSLFVGINIDCRDIIQDVFVSIIERTELRFDSVDRLSAYLYIAIKKKFLMSYRSHKTKERHSEAIVRNENFYVYKAVEAEVSTLLPEMLKIVPEECSKTIEMLAMGYSVKEIANEQKKPLSTIYSQRDRAFRILKRVLSKDELLMLFLG